MTTTISPTPLDQLVVAWLAHQRALGCRYDPEERVLKSLRAFLGQTPGRISIRRALINGARRSRTWRATRSFIANASSANSACIVDARSRAASCQIPCASPGASRSSGP